MLFPFYLISVEWTVLKLLCAIEIHQVYFLWTSISRRVSFVEPDTDIHQLEQFCAEGLLPIIDFHIEHHRIVSHEPHARLLLDSG